MSRTSNILTITALLALTAPAAASAAPTWSSPESLSPGPADGLGAAPAQVFAPAGGRSLVVGSDGVAPWLAVGELSGRFADRVPLGTGGSGAVDADLGADGTIAVAWASGGAAHVTVVRPGQTPGPQIDLPASGTNGVAVGVSPDGALTLAYRTKTGSNYAVDVVSAPAGGAFGAPVALDSGTGGIDSPDVATGPGGAVAVTYRKIIGRYRARVAVRPAGAAAFDAPQSVSTGDQAAIRTRVAFDSDGTVVAAWSDGASAQYALRPAAATSFGAPVVLGGGASSVSLSATPQGGAAATWAGNGTIGAAVQPPGGAFGASATVASYSSPIVPDPAISVAPGGLISVVYNDPADGAIHVADIGGASKVVGYGTPVAANSPAIAAAADRTVVAWRDATGGTSAAIRSESAIPGGPGTKPGGPDKKKPKVTIVTRSRTVRVTTKTTSIKLKVKCDEACSLSATADMTTRRGKRLAHAPTKPYTSKKAKTGTQTITLKLGSFASKDLKKALKAHRGANLSVDLTAVDRSTNATRKVIHLKLVAAKKKSKR